MIYEDIDRNYGADQFAGIGKFAYFCDMEEVNVLPSLPAMDDLATADESLVTIAADITFKSGGRWYRFPLTQEKATYENDGAGGTDAMGNENKPRLYIAGINPAVVGWFRAFKNRDLLLLMPHADGSANRLFGDALNACKITGYQERQGVAVTDEPFIQVDCRYAGNVAAFYTGDITLTPAV